MKMKVLDLLLLVYHKWGEDSIITNNWAFILTKKLLNFFNEILGVALSTFGFLTCSGGLKMEHWTKMGNISSITEWGVCLYTSKTIFRYLEAKSSVDVFERSWEMAPMFYSFVKDALTFLKYAYKITFSLDILCFSLNLVKNPFNWESMCLMYCRKKK